MKIFQLIILLTVFYSVNNYSQVVPDLPIAISYASAEVWGDSIYFFGGSNDYNGTELYKRIYKYNGTSWSYYDSIPFNHVWSIETAIKGDTVFLYGGWSGGGRKLYSYRLSAKTWTQLAEGPSTFANYGHTLEYFNGILYAFYNGYAASYSPSLNSWTNLATNINSASFSSSTIYNGEIYLAGWSNSLFLKYNPVTNQWTQLQDVPEFLSGGALRAIGNKIYLVGGSSGFSGGTSWNIYEFNPSINQWVLGSQFSSKRAYMEDIIYQNKFYILGGVNENTAAVNKVEYIMDQPTSVKDNFEIVSEFYLNQNYPNPFNPSTKIRYSIPTSPLNPSPYQGEGQGVRSVTLKVYDVLGNEVATLVNEEKPAGVYEVEFNASKLSSGIYFYKLSASGGSGFQKGQAFTEMKKMVLIK